MHLLTSDEKIEAERFIALSENGKKLSELNDDEINKNLAQIGIIINVTKLPDDFTKRALQDLLREPKYSHLTEKEFYAAFKQNLMSESPAIHYNTLSFGYVSIVLNAFLAARLAVSVKINKKMNQLPQEGVKVPDEAELRQKTHLCMNRAFEDYKRGHELPGQMWIEYYEMFVRGKYKFSPSAKALILAKAKVEHIRYKTNLNYENNLRKLVHETLYIPKQEKYFIAKQAVIYYLELLSLKIITTEGKKNPLLFLPADDRFMFLEKHRPQIRAIQSAQKNESNAVIPTTFEAPKKWTLTDMFDAVEPKSEDGENN